MGILPFIVFGLPISKQTSESDDSLLDSAYRLLYTFVFIEGKMGHCHCINSLV